MLSNNCRLSEGLISCLRCCWRCISVMRCLAMFEAGVFLQESCPGLPEMMSGFLPCFFFNVFSVSSSCPLKRWRPGTLHQLKKVVEKRRSQRSPFKSRNWRKSEYFTPGGVWKILKHLFSNPSKLWVPVPSKRRSGMPSWHGNMLNRNNSLWKSSLSGV